MFQLDTMDRAVIYRRPTGRLMRPSDRMIPLQGLGELGDILDTFKRFGYGLVQSATFGIYNPSKGKFYIPFTSGQMTNWGQGLANTATLGLVKTDKFFDSKAMKTVGTIAGVAAAGATAYFGGQYLMKQFGGSSTAATSPTGTNVANVSPQDYGSNVIGKALQPSSSTTASLFSKISLPSLDTVSKTLDITSKLAPAIAGRGGGMLPPPMGGGGPPVVIINQPSGPVELPMGPGQIPGQSYGYGYDPSVDYSNLMPPGGGMMYTGGGGGGGGIGPPGSEYGAMPTEVMDQNGVMQPVEGMSMGTKLILVGGVGLVAYMLFVK